MTVKFQYIKGDLLDTKDFFIAHCVNAQGAFGSGVAGALAKKYVPVKEKYCKWISDTQLSSNNKDEYYDFIGGRVMFDETSDNLHCIAHIVGQKYYGADGFRYISYDWIYDGFMHFKDYIADQESFSIPFIGCGLAGGKWNIVKSIIEEVFSDKNVTVNVYYLDVEERIKILGV
jgi:O-acetyl-ADP-ribose deacetylase (regulator of RNase III)